MILDFFVVRVSSQLIVSPCTLEFGSVCSAVHTLYPKSLNVTLSACTRPYNVSVSLDKVDTFDNGFAHTRGQWIIFQLDPITAAFF